MTGPCFDLLRGKIKIGIGERKFRSEACIESFLSHPSYIQYACMQTTGGFNSGEIKLVIISHLTGVS